MHADDFDAILSRRLSRRDALRGLAGAAAYGALPGLARASGRDGRSDDGVEERPRSTLTFAEVPRGSDGRVHVPPGYRADVLVAWGDPLFADAPAFAPRAQTADAQVRQFGANADWVAFLPLPRGGSGAERGLLCVNHEFASLHMLVPGIARGEASEKATRELCELEMAAIGHSLVEVERASAEDGGGWRVVRDGALNRRIDARDTVVRFSGQAAGHARLASPTDPDGERVRTFNNCAGGVTPWGTILICEENFNWHFAGHTEDAREAANHARYGVGDELVYAWHRHFPHFDVAREPHEPNRYGWVVEIDPSDPSSAPVKRTSLGRFKHESATCTLAADGRVVVYSGDDDEFQYLYRYVSRRRFDPAAPQRNAKLLDEGTLWVARFADDGTLEWLPLIFGSGGLVPANGFQNQGDVMIETRRAAELLGATPMDRPEDIEVHPADGRVFVCLTKNRRRDAERAHGANPRAENRHGHVLELLPPPDEDGRPDHGATVHRWDLLLLAGDPRAEGSGARYHPDVSRDGWLSCPDNAACDPRGRLWIATDGAPSASGCADGLFACDTEGPGRALTRSFLRGPRGCEVCGPCLTPDGRTLFVAIQHPGEADDRGSPRGTSFDTPTTRFPDFSDELPTRSAVVAIVREDGGEIGA